MQSKVRLAILVVFALLTASVRPVQAAGFDDKTIDQESINALQAKILLAQPREQCFLYAELVHEMTEFSLRQYAAGDGEKAAGLLMQVQKLAHKMHLSMSDDDKRLKNAQILLRHTAFRLNEMLHNSSLEDRPLVAETLAQVNQAQDEAMMQVFRK
jgi:non-ribosomal peptide synthetase component E (peptide arylation enzyme)